MNTYFRASILLFILTFMQVSLLGQSDDLRTEIDKIIRFDTEIDFKKTPGFIVSVIDNDRVFHYAFGNKIKGDHVQLTADDIFEIGSVTKVFTATLISTLVKEGKMSLEDP
ncbi:MAG: serine hydrolase, partial [Saprospiraceae bacterium]